MIKTLVTWTNNLHKLFRVSPTALVQGRDNLNLQKRLNNYHEQSKIAILQQQAYKIRIANLGPTQGQIQTLKRAFKDPKSTMTFEQFHDKMIQLEDKLEIERQQRAQKLGHL